ncbi:MAG: hypothetical protein AAF630_10980, partial [Cyanobacteria bacterium P01_C01_bin.38]
MPNSIHHQTLSITKLHPLPNSIRYPTPSVTQLHPLPNSIRHPTPSVAQLHPLPNSIRCPTPFLMESIIFLFTASLLAGIVNGNKIFWFEALIMASGAIIGAYSSVYLARKLHPLWIRNFIIGISLSMTC